MGAGISGSIQVLDLHSSEIEVILLKLTIALNLNFNAMSIMDQDGT